MPELDDADVVVISLGGNDLLGTMDASAITDPEGALENAYEVVAEVSENVLTIVEEIREHNDDIDVVYALYVDYGQATVMPWNFVSGLVGAEAITELLATARTSLPPESGILIADLFEASHNLEDLDSYLADALHFNNLGHTFYAEEVFKTLGGVLVGDSPLGGEPRSPLGLSQDFSFVP